MTLKDLLPGTQQTKETPEPQRARITWRETPDKGFGKPRTVSEVWTALDPDDLHRKFWANPAWDVSKTRKVEITEVKWLNEPSV